MQKTLKVAFLTSHPIQYQVPVFRELSKFPEIDLTVLFCQIPDEKTQGAGFGVSFTWDIPILEGYKYVVLENKAKIPSVTDFYGCNTPGIKQVLKDNQIDVLIINGWVVYSCIQGLMAARSLGIPAIVRGESNDKVPRAWWKRFVQSLLINRFDRFLYIGEANKQFYKKRGIPDSKLFPAKYCIENDRFAKAVLNDREIVAWRQKYNIPHEQVCFLYCGKLIPKKHPVELIQAFQSALKQGMQASLLIVGSGELESECRTAAQNSPYIIFAGFLNQQEITKSYYATDCLLLPSDAWETWGLVTNEAMACGRPALVSDQAGCSGDLIKPGLTGEIFNFGNWDQLRQKLIEFSQSRDKLLSMGLQAKNLIADYSPAHAATGIKQALADLMLSNKNSFGNLT